MNDRDSVIMAAKVEFDSAGADSILHKLTSRVAFVGDALHTKGLAPLTEQERESLGEVVTGKR